MTSHYSIERTIHSKGWDIDYSNGTATSILGQEYTVTIQKSEGCLDLAGHVNYLTGELTLIEPCEGKHNFYESQEEAMAYTLAHELGHTDTCVISTGLPVLIMLAGIAGSINCKNIGPFLGAAGLTLAWKCIGDELLAEAAASKYHGVPFMEGIYKALPNLESMIMSVF